MVWMITLHKGFVKSFFEGEKNIELRTKVPKALRQGDILLVAQSGTHNRVVMIMSVLWVIRMSPSEMFDKHYKEIQLNYLAYEDYTKAHKWVYGIWVNNVEKIEEELHTSDFGIEKAPQWFREVKKGHKYIK